MSASQEKVSTHLCAQDSWKGNGSVMFGHRAPGEYSMTCHVAIRDAHGRIFDIRHNYDTSDRYAGTPTFSISECKILSFQRRRSESEDFFEMEGCTPRMDLMSKVLGWP
jgi:hypothetical protein